MSETLRCPRCSVELSDGARFCSVCGSSVSSTSQAPTTFASQSHSGVGRLYTSDSIDFGQFLPGTVIAERYRIVGLLGRGGMGEIYRADDLKLQQPIALKFLPPSLAQDPARLERFHAEVRLARQVSHPNVCRVYDLEELDGQPFLAMEYVDGEDLSSLLKRIGRLSGDKGLEIARQICAGLAAAHDRGVLHRDLKPANIMIDGQGRARIADFGLAAAVSDGRESGLSGTLAYMAPEQLAGKGASIQSDIYALGLVLYELFTGRKPFDGQSLAELKRSKQEEPITSPSQFTPDIDPVVEQVLMRCLESDPRMRPPSALQVALALPGGDPIAAALAAGETPSPEMVAAAGRTGGLRPAIAWACLASILLFSVLTVVLFQGARLYRQVRLDKPPDVLVERSREILATLGYPAAASTAYGFDSDAAYFRWVYENDTSRNRWERLPPDALYFWYRQSPRSLVPESFFRTRVDEDDPPGDVSGMASVKLDTSGRLVGLDVVPPQVDSDASAAAPSPDWGALFAAAGLERSAWTPVEPAWIPPSYADSRAAWEGFLAERPALKVRIEAAAYRGKPIYFQKVAPWNRPTRMETQKLRVQDRIVIGFGLVLICGLLVGGAILARRNLMLGRGDRKGAFRLALFVVVTLQLSWLLGASHAIAPAEVLFFIRSSSFALFFAGFLWLIYLSVEPYVRRRWPQAMVSWSRLLAGSWSDPLVGRDVLIGCLAFAVLRFLVGFGRALPSWLGDPPAGPTMFEPRTLSGGLVIVSLVLGRLWVSVFAGFVFLFLLVVLRMLLRKTSLAAAALVLILGVVPALGQGATWITPFLAAIGLGTTLFVLVRFGVVAAIAADLVSYIFELFPVTTDVSAWYAWLGFLGIALALGLAVHAFKVSLGGRPVFGATQRRD